MHVVYEASEADHDQVYVDSTQGPVVGGLFSGRATAFGPKGKHVSYMVTERDNSNTLVLDGKVVARKVDRYYPMRFTADGTPVYIEDTYHANGAPKGSRVVVGDRPGREYPYIDSMGIVMSSDGEHFAYLAYKECRAVGTQDTGWNMRPSKTAVVVDGHEGPVFDKIQMIYPWTGDQRFIVFSPDGDRHAYIGKRGDSYHVVIDGKVGKPYERTAGQYLQFGPQGKQVVYGATRKGRSYVVANGREQPWLGPPALGNPGTIVLGPNGKRLAYVVRIKGGGRVVLDGKKVGPWYPTFMDRSLKFTPGGPGVSWIHAREDGKAVVVIDGKPCAPLEEVKKPGIQFSPDGKRVAYAGRLGEKWHVFLDGKKGPAFDDMAPHGFSPDGSGYLYLGLKKDKWYVCLNEKRFGPYAEILKHWPRVTPDGKHVVCVHVVQKGDDEVLRLTVDGQVLGEFDEFYGSGPWFRKDGSFELLACRKNVLYRVRCSPPASEPGARDI